MLRVVTTWMDDRPGAVKFDREDRQEKWGCLVYNWKGWNPWWLVKLKNVYWAIIFKCYLKTTLILVYCLTGCVFYLFGGLLIGRLCLWTIFAILLSIIHSTSASIPSDYISGTWSHSFRLFLSLLSQCYTHY